MLGMRFPMGRVLAGPRGAALSLDFVTPGASLDSRVTFSRASGATYFDAAGVMQIAGNNIARLDFDPVTLAPRGLLIEETRTNMPLRSAEIDNVAWTKFQSSITADMALAPDGNMAADKVVENTATSQHGVFQSTAKAASAITYSATAFFKAAERTSVRMLMEGSASGNAAVTVNLSAGTIAAPTVSGFTGASASIYGAGNAWYRPVLTATTNTNTGVYFTAYMMSGANISYTGDGSSGLTVWGVQLEVGAYPTSYIPTTSASATRAADLATIDLSTVPVDFAAFSLLHAFTHAGAETILTLDDGTTTEVVRLVVSAGTLRLQVVDGGSTVADIAVGAVSIGSTYRVAARIAANDVAVSVNGGAVATDSSVTVPALTRLAFGQAWHRELSFYEDARTDAFLQQVTA